MSRLKLICCIAIAAVMALPSLASGADRYQGTATWYLDETWADPTYPWEKHVRVMLPVDSSWKYGDPGSFDFSSPPTASGTYHKEKNLSDPILCDEDTVVTYDSVKSYAFTGTRLPNLFELRVTVGGESTTTYSGSSQDCADAPPGHNQFEEEFKFGCGLVWDPRVGFVYPRGYYKFEILESSEDGQSCTGEATYGVVAPPPGLDLRISPVESEGSGENFPVTVTVRNTSGSESIDSIGLDYPYGFGVANSYYPAGEQGEIKVVAGPVPAFPTSLGPGESSVHTVTVKATAPGKVGLETKGHAVGATTENTFLDKSYGEVVVGETEPNDAERTAAVATGVALFLNRSREVMRDQEARYAKSLFNVLKKRLSARAQRFYFGAKGKLKITRNEQALAQWRGLPAELMALVTPNRQKLFKDGSIYLNQKQFARFQQLHNAELQRLTGNYLRGVADSTIRTISNEARYWSGLASVEGMGRISADIALWRELNKESGENLLAALSVSGASRALDEANTALIQGFERAVNNALEAREARIGKLSRLAEKNPDAFIRQIANDTAKMGFEAFKVSSDILMGEAAFKLAGKVFTGVRASVARFTKAIGASTPAEAKTLARTTLIGERSATLGPSYMDDLSEEAKSMISLRRMEDIGGMPVADVATTREMVDQTNARLGQLGYKTEIEVLFRPPSPYRVEGAFAKVETVGVKNIAPIDLALGAPPSILAETAVFKPINPEKLAGFKSYSNVEQILLKERYKTRLSEFNQFHGIDPVTDKKMKAMLKAFDRIHVFDEIGKGREISMKLSTVDVQGATVLKYDYLKVEGKVLINGKAKPRSIGTDFDQAAIIDKNTRQLLKGDVLSAAEAELRRLGERAAVEKGYANPFHGATAHGTDADAADYPFIAHFWLTHLKEADAIREAERLAANYNRGRDLDQQITAARILSKTAGLYERHLLRINASDASFGPADVIFRTPVVVP